MPARDPHLAGARAPRRGARALAAAALLAAVLLALPGSAFALKLRPCASDPGFGCGTLTVPLDHSGRAAGTIKLAVAAQRDYPKGAGLLIALSGGPGQSSVDAAGSFADSLAPALRRYRMVVLDQRGTGESGALSCPGLQNLGGLDPFTPKLVVDCQRRIGYKRSFYRTLDTVQDLNDLRLAFGARKVALMGISYGTWVAQEFARRYPQRTDRLILDSVVGPDPTDAFLLDSYSRLPRILREQCAKNRCRSATPDVMADLAAVTARLNAGPIRGQVYDAKGRARPTRVLNQEDLFYIVSTGDLNGYMQARLPGALAAAAQGDDAALLRLVRIAAGTPTPTKELSFGLNATTGCLDTTLPFSLTSDPASRPPLIDAAVAAVPPASYAPWSTATLRATSYVSDCVYFPRQREPRPPVLPLPDVKTLLLAGRLDLRTPVENAQEVKALLPRSSLVTVPGNGHDQVDTDMTGCVARALERFVADRAVGDPCKGKTNQVKVLARPPRSIASFAAGSAGDRGRVLRAALDTADEARFSAIEAVYAGFNPLGGGLRGGSFKADDAFYGTIRLRNYTYVPGVRLTGHLDVLGGTDISGVVSVSGRISGKVTIRSASAASGVLGGRRVSVVRAASSAAAGPVAPAPRPVSRVVR